MLIAIDERQPVQEQLGAFLIAKEIPTSQLKIGDKVYIFDGIYHNKYEIYDVVGFGEEEYVNGIKTKGVPYVNRYGDENRGYAWNCNNYITNDTVRIQR